MRKFKKPVTWRTFTRRINAKNTYRNVPAEVTPAKTEKEDQLMGKYLSIQISPQFCSESSLQSINRELIENYKCPPTSDVLPMVVNTRESVHYDAMFMNSDPEGLAQVTHIARPITPEVLQNSFSKWFDYGYFQVKLSGGMTAIEARRAIAVARWAIENESKLNTRISENYDLKTIKQYCGDSLSAAEIKFLTTDQPQILKKAA